MAVIDDYLTDIPEPQRSILEGIRHIVQQTAPDAVEVITYGMPGFTYNGHYLIGFNARKHHLAIYPTSAPIAVLKDKLVGYDLSKGTIRFSVDKPLPKSLIAELVHVRIAQLNDSHTV